MILLRSCACRLGQVGEADQHHVEGSELSPARIHVHVQMSEHLRVLAERVGQRSALVHLLLTSP